MSKKDNNISSFRIAHSKIWADGEKYFSLFEKHIPEIYIECENKKEKVKSLLNFSYALSEIEKNILNKLDNKHSFYLNNCQIFNKIDLNKIDNFLSKKI